MFYFCFFIPGIEDKNFKDEMAPPGCVLSMLPCPLQCELFTLIVHFFYRICFVQCLYSSISALNNVVGLDILCKELLFGEITTLIWIHCVKKKKSVMEDERNGKAQRCHTHRNAKCTFHR